LVRFIIDLQGKTREVADARDSQELASDPALGAAIGKGGKGAGYIEDPTVLACVLDAFKGLQFPLPQGGGVKVIYPLSFAPK
jgi:hypothetical protein